MSTTRYPIVWLIWDAAADWAARTLIAEGALPALAHIASSGVQAAAWPPRPNCQTPPGLATLFTGVWPRRHGIRGFFIPDPTLATAITATQSGFDPAWLTAKPIWEHIAHQGACVATSYIPWVMKPDGTVPSGCVFASEGYSRRVSRGGCVQLKDMQRQGAGKISVQLGTMYHLVVESQGGKIDVEIVPTGQRFCFDSAEEKGWVSCVLDEVAGTGITLRLWRYPASRELLLLYSGVWQVRTYPPEAQKDFLAVAGPFFGEGLGSWYRRGMFGPRLLEGGNGEAEQMLAQTIAPAAEYFQRASLASARYASADLYISYQPCIDDVEHELLGWCDPHSKAYQPSIARQAWSAIRAVYQMADRHLAVLLKHFGEECTFIISSDHGMAGMIGTVHINEALRQQGLTAFTPEGNVDLRQTTIVYHPADNGSLWINDMQRPDGIVHPEEKEELLTQAIYLLRNLRNPLTGERVIHAIYPSDDGTDAGWVPAMGDLFLAAGDGYELSADPSPTGQIVIPTRKSASHATYVDRASLQGIFYAKGPGICRNTDLGQVDNRDVFPFICHQLGLEPLPEIEGKLQMRAFSS